MGCHIESCEFGLIAEEQRGGKLGSLYWIDC